MFNSLHRSLSGDAFPDTPPSEHPHLLKSSLRRNSRDLNSYFRGRENDRALSPPPQPLSQRLTTTLLEATPSDFQAATQHPFLQLAGQGKISIHDLSRWLSQDRLYAEAYISFISSLIARVVLPYSFVTNKQSSLRWRILNLCTSALQNIYHELDFFTQTAQRYALNLDTPFTPDTSLVGPNPITEQYITLFRSFHLDPQQSLLEGLLVLWATEKCYLEAWTYASTHLAQDVDATLDADGGALRNEFIPNWSSSEFEGFVRELADVLDELALREGALRKVEVYKALWLHVLDIEKGFWPDVDGGGEVE